MMAEWLVRCAISRFGRRAQRQVPAAKKIACVAENWPAHALQCPGCPGRADADCRCGRSFGRRLHAISARVQNAPNMNHVPKTAPESPAAMSPRDATSATAADGLVLSYLS